MKCVAKVVAIALYMYTVVLSTESLFYISKMFFFHAKFQNKNGDARSEREWENVYFARSGAKFQVCCCWLCYRGCKWTWVEDISTSGNRQCSTHCRELLLKYSSDPLTSLELLNYYNTAPWPWVGAGINISNRP